MTALPKQIEKRLEQAGLRYDIPTLHLVSDIMGICAIEASSWINHWADADELPWPDAVRIPDLLRDTSNALRSSAKKLDDEISKADDRIEQHDM